MTTMITTTTLHTKYQEYQGEKDSIYMSTVKGNIEMSLLSV